MAIKKGRSNFGFGLSWKKLAATYSRGVYKTTTIGKTVFDGRVRNGNGSDHSFMATKLRSQKGEVRSANLTPSALGFDSILKNVPKRDSGVR